MYESRIEEAETDHIRDVLAPLVQDLHDWRIEVQRLFDRTKAAQEARIVDLAAFEDVDTARAGLDMQIDLFDDAVNELGGEESVVADQLGQLGEAFQDLRLATERIKEVLD